METTATSLPLMEQVKEYLDIKFKLLKYEGIDKASAIIAEIIRDLLIVILALVTFIFFTLTLALLIAYLLHSYWQGFACVTVLYMILLCFARLLKISFQNLFIRLFIQKLFKERS